MKKLTFKSKLLTVDKKSQAVVSSLEVAKAFDRRHADVLRALDSLIESGHFNRREIALVEYKDK